MLLFLLLPHNSQGIDGCKDYDFWKCGDVCTSYYSECLCGKETLKYSDSRWCCGSQCTKGSCLRWKDGFKGIEYNCAKWSPAACTTGVVLNLTQACSNTCNEYLQDDYRNYKSPRSHISACKAPNTCVKEGEGNTNKRDNFKQTICMGDSSCDGELAWCKEEKRKSERCPEQFTRSRCLPTLGGGKNKKTHANGIPGQCYDKEKKNDGKIYQCFDRTDEIPFDREGSSAYKQNIDFKQLKSCTYFFYPGLKCGRERSSCLKFSYWCNDKRNPEECPLLGAGILTNDKRVCEKTSLWREQQCEDPYHIRCRAGNSGQCVEKQYWGVEGAKDDTIHGEDVATCKDGSDLYRPIGKEAGHHPLPSGHRADEDIVKAEESDDPNDYSGEGQQDSVDYYEDEEYEEYEDYEYYEEYDEYEEKKYDEYEYDDNQANEIYDFNKAAVSIWKTKPLKDIQYNRNFKGTEAEE